MGRETKESRPEKSRVSRTAQPLRPVPWEFAPYWPEYSCLPAEHPGEHRGTRAKDSRRSGRRLPLKSLAPVGRERWAFACEPIVSSEAV